MYYYRTGLAASALDPDFLDRAEASSRLASTDVVRTTGITAALSHSAAAMLDRLVDLVADREFVLSIDLNWRPTLWRGRDTAPLRDLLRAVDVVLLATRPTRSWGPRIPTSCGSCWLRARCW